MRTKACYSRYACMYVFVCALMYAYKGEFCVLKKKSPYDENKYLDVEPNFAIFITGRCD